jgi:hypothetical protein
MKKIIKRTLFTIILIPVILLRLVVTPYIVVPILNNISLSGFSRQIYKYPLPQNTVFIEKEAVCGKLNGNGNGMDFFACFVIKSDMSIEQLSQYYKDKKFKPAKKDKKHVVGIEVMPVNGEQLITDYVKYEKVRFSKLKDINDYSGYYVVMIYDGGYSALFDIRGH